MPKYYGKNQDFIEIESLIDTEEIQQIRKDQGYPEWTNEQVKQWVESYSYEDDIIHAMNAAGIEWIHDNIDKYSEEELELREKE